jgi:rRNA maturation endonuclease Nob1
MSYLGWRMFCEACRRAWLRFGHLPTLCPFCGSTRTVAVRELAEDVR